MSLDDLLPLLLILAFIGNALLRGRRASRRGQGQGRTGRRGRAGTDAAGQEAPSAERRAAAGEQGESAADDLQRRIEEARRRVRQASEGSGSGERADAGSRSSGGARSGAPASGGTSGAGGPAARPNTAPAPFLGREGTSPLAPSKPSPRGFLGREGPPPKPRAPRRAERASGRRDAGDRSARLARAHVLGGSPEDVVRGVMWSVVLGPPVARRARRRMVSPRRSP